MRDVCSLIWLALIGLFRSRASLQVEILTLLNVLRRKSPQRLGFTSIDRLIFAGLYRLAPGVLDALKIVRPETASLGDSNTSSTQIRFSVHTARFQRSHS
jgi:hypothetical protein